MLSYTLSADKPDILQYMRFGIVPYWAKSLKLTYDAWNIRSENILESKIYRPLIRNHKTCLIIANGFYEWL